MKKTIVLLFALAVAAPLFGATVRKEIEASPGERLEVSLRGGSIEIAGWDRNLVSVEATIAGRDAGEAGIEVRRTGSSVRIDQQHGGRASGGRVDLRIRVPARFDLALETMGGTLEIENVRGSLEGSTHGGNLRLSRLQGSVTMSTHGGNITLRDSTVDGSVRTMGGQVLLENVVGDIEGQSMGGDVVYRNVTRGDGSSTGKAVHITTMGGDVTVADAPAGAELSTMGGNISVASARQFVKARTMGGSIEVDAIDGWIEATTMGGDVRAVMIGNPARGDRHAVIESKSGSIDLTLPAGLDMDLDVEIVFTRNSRRNYEIRSDFPLTITTTPDWTYGQGDPRRIIRGRGRTGSGKNRITIRTINGDVTIRQAR